ncbi:hypothetical protein [Pseudonocardia yuanmonensis]|uniref:hypothetical protein n=1 Tax=Pseudonocardia yuanmonensis TaxID=1095914 RepID=UPI0031EDB21C
MIAGLMAVASAAGLWWRGLYQDPEPVVAMLRGYDLVSLIIAVPALVAALLRTRGGSARADLVVGGLLGYAFYHYANFVLGTTFNALFLLHLAVFVLSGAALVQWLRGLDVAHLATRFRAATPARWIAGVLALLATTLGGMWIYYSVRFAISGATPGESRLVLPVQAVHLGYVMDLALLVPAYATAAALLWRRKPWGYVAAAVLLVSAGMSQLDYMSALLFQAAARLPGATAFDPAEPIIAGIIIGAAVALLGTIRDGDHRPEPVAAGAIPEAEEGRDGPAER